MLMGVLDIRLLCPACIMQSGNACVVQDSRVQESKMRVCGMQDTEMQDNGIQDSRMQQSRTAKAQKGAS